jgi:threonine synthase
VPGNLAPDHVFVPTGDGVIIAGVIRGFEDLLRLGRIDRMPTVWAAQAEGSSAIARALETGVFEPRPSSTIADSISVDVPRNGYFALDRLRRHSGRAVVVNDGDILAAQRYLSRTSGLFAEPSSACAFAGFLKVKGELDPNARVVVMLTGSGLKDIKSAAKAVGLAVEFWRRRSLRHRALCHDTRRRPMTACSHSIPGRRQSPLKLSTPPHSMEDMVY